MDKKTCLICGMEEHPEIGPLMTRCASFTIYTKEMSQIREHISMCASRSVDVCADCLAYFSECLFTLHEYPACRNCGRPANSYWGRPMAQDDGTTLIERELALCEVHDVAMDEEYDGALWIRLPWPWER